MERLFLKRLANKVLNFRLITPGFNGNDELDRLMNQVRDAPIQIPVTIYKEPDTKTRDDIAFLKGEDGSSDLIKDSSSS